MKYLASDPIPPGVASGVSGVEPRAAWLANGAGAAAPTAVRVRPFAAADRAAWNAFVLAHPDGTFFHQAEWQDVLQQSFGHRTHFLLAERDGGVCGVLPLAEVKSLLFGHALVSTPFCVYGGIVAADDDSFRALDDQGGC